MIDRQVPATLGRITVWLCGSLAVAVLGTGSSATAQAQAPKAEARAKGGPTAESVLQRTADFYKKAGSFTVEAERAQKVGPLAVKSKITVAFQRPNRFACRSEGMMPGIDVVSDGKTMSLSVGVLQKYTQTKAPGSIDGITGDPIVQGALVGLLAGDLCADDPYKKLMSGVKSATYAGEETVEGKKVHRIKLSDDKSDREIWIAADGDPTLRRVILDLSKAIASMPGGEQIRKQLNNQKLELVHNFKDWHFDPKLDEKTFEFEPPKGAQKTENLLGGVAGGGREEAKSPLLGKPAPEVSLKLLEKGEFTLKSHRDNSVVMLDFWATWCGPCVQELPILAEVAADYKDKGVVFCAINLQEDPADVTKFLKEKKLGITVALDSKGEIGRAYGAEAIPMLVLIDKKGVVRSVHVGYNPAIKATLSKELDALLAAKDLAKPVRTQAKTSRLEAP
jgi:thiol-disulfide isomerase/thioredoxin